MLDFITSYYKDTKYKPDFEKNYSRKNTFVLLKISGDKRLPGRLIKKNFSKVQNFGKVARS